MPISIVSRDGAFEVLVLKEIKTTQTRKSMKPTISRGVEGNLVVEGGEDKGRDSIPTRHTGVPPFPVFHEARVEGDTGIEEVSSS